MTGSAARRSSGGSKIEELPFEPLPTQEEFLLSTADQVLLSGSFGAGKCVHPDTEIRLSDGRSKRIRGVEVGDEVVSFDDDAFELTDSEVTAVVDTGKKEAYEVTLMGGRSVVVSKDHPFFAVTDMAHRRRSPYHDDKCRKVPVEYGWRNTEDLSRMDLIAVPWKEQETSGDDSYSPDEYALLGLLIGDGHIKETGVQVSIAHDRVEAWASELVPDPAVLKKYGNSCAYGVSVSRGGNKQLEEGYVNPVMAMLSELNLLGTNSHTKFVPEEIFTASAEARSAFLSGLFVADGWVADPDKKSEQTASVGFTSVSERLARGVHKLLASLGIHSVFNVGRVKYEGEYRARYRTVVSRPEDMTRLHEHLDMLHKSKKLDSVLEEKTEKNYRGINKDYRHDEVVFKRVKSIEHIGDVSMYDLEVDGTHSFIGNGIILHNSRIGCEKGFMLNLRYPGNRGLIVRKSLKDVKASTVNQTLLPEVIPRSHIPDKATIGGDKVKGHTKRENIIRHRTGQRDSNGDPVLSEIYYYGVEGGRGARDDDLPEKIGSTAFGWIFVDEGTELERGEWNQLYGRLRYKGKKQAGHRYTVPFRQIFTATNPDSPNHWMHEHFRPDEPSKGAGEVFKMNLFDNPHLPDQYVENLEKNLSGMYYKRYVEGEWVGAEGIVYEEFDPAQHLVGVEGLPRADQWAHHGEEEHEEGEKSVYVTPPPDWRIYRAIDLGLRHPFVCLWWAESPDGKLVMFREIYETDKLVEDHAKRINALTPDRDVEMTVADHDAEQVEVLRRNGVESQPAKKDVEAGIQSVKSRMKMQDDGKPGLYFLKNARAHKPDVQLKLNDKPTKTVDEIYGYSWEDNKEEEPEKEDDHGMDAMRYIIHTRDGGPVLTTEEMEEYEEVFNDEWD